MGNFPVENRQIRQGGSGGIVTNENEEANLELKLNVYRGELESD